MAWLRRFNENNVDLNRNFLRINKQDAETVSRFEDAFSSYGRFNSFINPQSPPASDFFFLKAVGLIMKHGMPALKQSVVAGQYWFPAGLFFGGKLSKEEADMVCTELEQGSEQYQSFLSQRLEKVERIVSIDVHTGLGKHGEDTLLADQKVYFVTQEFGTYGPMKVLHALREENRWHHYGAGTLDHPTKQILKETFYPQHETWRARVLHRGKELLEQGLSNL